MKKSVVVILAFLLIFGLTMPAYCAGPITKLGRGFSNLLTFPCEVPWQIEQAGKQNGITAAWSYGILNGIFMAGVRAVVGAYEVATFPVPFPGNFEPILTDPEFFFKTQ